jgi:hypothetical protein
MGEFESQIGYFQYGGEFLFEHMCTFEEWKHQRNSWSDARFSIAQGRAKVKLGEFVDGS